MLVVGGERSSFVGVRRRKTELLFSSEGARDVRVVLLLYVRARRMVGFRDATGRVDGKRASRCLFSFARVNRSVVCRGVTGQRALRSRVFVSIGWVAGFRRYAGWLRVLRLLCWCLGRTLFKATQKSDTKQPRPLGLASTFDGTRTMLHNQPDSPIPDEWVKNCRSRIHTYDTQTFFVLVFSTCFPFDLLFLP